MDKITIIPGSVRGYGDVVSPKTIEDFTVFDSELSFEDGLYTLVYDASGVSVGLSVSSSTISVGESVVCTAEVLSGGEPVSGETVSFYDGTSLLGTDETDSDGIATYTASSLSVGSHSLTAEALDKSSSAVTVTVNKLTSTITLSVPSTGTVGTSYTVSGTLVPTSGSVKLYENGSLKDTLTVSSGSFSKAITQSNEGTYSYYAVFEGSSTYSSVTSSTSSIVVSDVPPVPVVTSVSLTGDKSILSYADSESATLSATVLDQSSQPMSGVTVTFYNGSTSMGTADTNSSGVATKSYSSAGAGDVSFTASVGTISSETYSISDRLLYDTTEYSRTGTGSATSVATNNKTWDNTIDWEMTSEIKVTGMGCRIDIVPPSQSLNYHLGIGRSAYEQGSPVTTYVGKNGGGEVSENHTTMEHNVYHTVKISKEGTTVKFYFNGTLLRTDTTYAQAWIGNYSTESVKFTTWRSNTIYMKNLSVKPL